LDHFGYSVALYGDRALVSACHDDDNGVDSGSAYVFGYDSVSGTWQEEAKLLASDGASDDEFGWSVSFFGDRVLIGARGDDDNGSESGSAYVFGYDSGSATWHEEAKLLASDGQAYDALGYASALSGDVALVGAHGTDKRADSGSVYVYNFTGTLTLDIKCNGQDQNVIVSSSENVTLTIDIDSGFHPGIRGDCWVAVLPASTGTFWTYGPHDRPYWQNGFCNEYYTGLAVYHSATVLDYPLPVGGYKAFLAVDLLPNGELNMPFVWDFDVVDFTVQ